MAFYGQESNQESRYHSVMRVQLTHKPTKAIRQRGLQTETKNVAVEGVNDNKRSTHQVAVVSECDGSGTANNVMSV